VAIKISDGSKPALFAASVAVMDQLGWLDDVQRKALEPWRAQDLRSVKGQLVGQRRAVFELKRP
jgi:L-asparaginase II